MDGAIQGIKNCLRTQNQLRTLATLAALPSFFHLLTIHSPNGSTTPHDAAVLRQALAALLPAGGLVDRLGDNREKARENARQALVVLGGIVFSHSGLNASTGQSLKGKESMKGPEPPMAILERFIRELGLSSKVWRVREQVYPTPPRQIKSKLTPPPDNSHSGSFKTCSPLVPYPSLPSATSRRS